MAKIKRETVGKNLVTQSNRLINARAKMTLVEAKLVKLLASYVKPTDKDFKEYTFNKKQLMDALGMNEKNYPQLKSAIRNLQRRVYEFKTDAGWLFVSAVSSTEYRELEDTVSLCFDPKMRPYLLELRENFTSIQLENLFGLRSLYSLRLYEILKQREKLIYYRVGLAELRELLCAETIMPLYGDFKRRVLEMAQDELREKTDLRFKFSEEKKQRRVVAITFEIRPKHKKETDETSSRIREEIEASLGKRKKGAKPDNNELFDPR